MDDVFLNEVDLNGHEEWDTMAGSNVSCMPNNSEIEIDILAVQMDIASPLSTLKAILGHRLGADFSHCELWLQDVMQLSDETTLSEQCIQGEGFVQVNVELKSVENIDRINIVDVLKPQQEEETALNEPVMTENTRDQEENDATKVDAVAEEATNVVLETAYQTALSTPITGIPATNATIVQHSAVNPLGLPIKAPHTNRMSCKMPTSHNENITRWVMDGNFRKEQERLKIPLDPILWSKAHIQHWIRWAINQFGLKGVSPSQWGFVDGPSLCNMTHTEFIQRIPKNPLSKDPNHDLFWTHLELLRKCKFVGVIQKPVPYLQYITTPLTVKSDPSRMPRPAVKVATPTKRIPLESFSARSFSIATAGNRTGSNGQVQLWQFLLELLTDVNFREAISWLGTGGEFKLNNPEMVAQLWGERKNKPHMNYEKLSRALRYYYDGDMICKVSGKRFVYKFVCDLKQLLGYSADELNKLVTECEQRSKLGRSNAAYM